MKDVKELQQKYKDGDLNRRDFMKAVGALGITVSAAGSLLKATDAMAKTPRKGGSVRMASNLHGPDDQMDPIVMTSNIDYTRAHAAYNGLVQMRDNMQLKPELAEEYSPNSNATEWTFKLRKGVKFHDGSNFSADDVLWSMNRHLGEKTPSVIKGFFQSSQGMEESRQPYRQGNPQQSGFGPACQTQRKAGKNRQAGYD